MRLVSLCGAPTAAAASLPCFGLVSVYALCCSCLLTMPVFLAVSAVR